jgi:hypothetical protein
MFDVNLNLGPLTPPKLYPVIILTVTDILQLPSEVPKVHGYEVHVHMKGKAFATRFDDRFAHSSPYIKPLIPGNRISSDQGFGKTFGCYLYPDRDMELSEVFGLTCGPHFAVRSAEIDGPPVQETFQSPPLEAFKRRIADYERKERQPRDPEMEMLLQNPEKLEVAVVQAEESTCIRVWDQDAKNPLTIPLDWSLLRMKSGAAKTLGGNPKLWTKNPGTITPDREVTFEDFKAVINGAKVCRYIDRRIVLDWAMFNYDGSLPIVWPYNSGSVVVSVSSMIRHEIEPLGMISDAENGYACVTPLKPLLDRIAAVTGTAYRFCFQQHSLGYIDSPLLEPLIKGIEPFPDYRHWKREFNPPILVVRDQPGSSAVVGSSSNGSEAASSVEELDPFSRIFLKTVLTIFRYFASS